MVFFDVIVSCNRLGYEVLLGFFIYAHNFIFCFLVVVGVFFLFLFCFCRLLSFHSTLFATFLSIRPRRMNVPFSLILHIPFLFRALTIEVWLDKAKEREKFFDSKNEK